MRWHRWTCPTLTCSATARAAPSRITAAAGCAGGGPRPTRGGAAAGAQEARGAWGRFSANYLFRHMAALYAAVLICAFAEDVR